MSPEFAMPASINSRDDLDAWCRDEPPPISPVLVDSAVSSEPGVLVERLARVNDRVMLFLEDEGGGLWDEQCLGSLGEGLYSLVGPEHWPTVDAWLDQERDGREFARGCRMAQETYR